MLLRNIPSLRPLLSCRCRSLPTMRERKPKPKYWDPKHERLWPPQYLVRMKPGYTCEVAMQKIPISGGVVVRHWDPPYMLPGFIGVFKKGTREMLRAMPEVESVARTEAFYCAFETNTKGQVGGSRPAEEPDVPHGRKK
ncbi:hypothetical protein CVT26_011101 [Gymnopilus dilepis]|uniref:Uncharacterized protein n=1 Tax=Gymnopilus dilepis TaxID=231916 RepID=A0A409WRJ5_9AGAR|nr:hypothetical protein CVT26_011101 [Gymnopilus dilepis]